MHDHTARKPPLAGPTHSDHYCTWSSGVPTVHDDAVVSAHHLGASSEPIIPAGEANVLFRCIWDCKAAEGPCWRSGGRQRCSSPCCQADIPNLRRQEVSELCRLWCGAGQRYICSPRASLVGVAVKILKGLIFKMLPLLFSFSSSFRGCCCCTSILSGLNSSWPIIGCSIFSFFLMWYRCKQNCEQCLAGPNWC